MKQKFAVAAAMLMLSVFAVFTSISAAQPSSGVKAGDWIEYSVTYTGSPSAGHNIDFARMDILQADGPLIYVMITSTYENGTTVITNSTLNLQTGKLIDDFIIPAGLTKGDVFLDSNYGNISIQNVEAHNYAGASRTVLYAVAENNTYVWDQATGVSLEGTSQTPEYTIHSLATATNMWQPAPELRISILIALVVVVIILIGVSVGAYLYHKKRGSHADAAASVKA
jgi:hypothetical protein